MCIIKDKNYYNHDEVIFLHGCIVVVWRQTRRVFNNVNNCPARLVVRRQVGKNVRNSHCHRRPTTTLLRGKRREIIIRRCRKKENIRVTIRKIKYLIRHCGCASMCECVRFAHSVIASMYTVYNIIIILCIRRTWIDNGRPWFIVILKQVRRTM